MIFILLTVCFLHVPGNNGASDTKRVVQTPRSITKGTGESVDGEINCSHSITDYQSILWYKQDEQKAPKFLGYLNLNYPAPAADVRGKITFKGDARKHSDLQVSDLVLNDSGVYFCAASRHSAAESTRVKTKTLESTDRMFSHLNTCRQPVWGGFLGSVPQKYWGEKKCLVGGDDVTQTPVLWEDAGDNATIHCGHTKGSGYFQMYWYRQLPGETMRQILFAIPNKRPEYEPDFGEEKFPATKPDAHSGTLTVTDLVPADKGLYFCAVSFIDGGDVAQPSTLWKDEGDAATINCSHTKDATYYQMYWFRQLPGEGMKQIVCTTPTPPHRYESGFSEDKFPAQKSDALTGSLTVEKLLPGDSGVYFCAVSQHSDGGDSGSCTKTLTHRCQ
ncbi:hypothetical protein F2P81_003061 [Scophthalmus maximus]|uniref:Ig-like domain-containing protein n=1 Tax=Scophthalmus maximus TaxID=52904 RepID=A0A6A4TD39_SCOMX|nr:hypothetical protein F2P81_003061 [Scophthalmus maximus]